MTARKPCTLSAALIAISLAAVVAVKPAAAEMIFIPPVGGNGDREGPPMVCPNSHPLLTGVFGRVGSWIDQLGILCSSLKPGWVTSDVIKHEYRGGSGGADVPLVTCNANAGIRRVEIQIAYNKGRPQYVTAVSFDCHKPSTGALANKAAFGASWFRDPFDARKNFSQACPGNTYAVGFDARWGRHVNALGLICEELKEPVIFIVPPVPEPLGPGMENNTNRPFSDFYDYVPAGGLASCQSMCRVKRDKCRAWTYVRPGASGQKGRCYLKHSVPTPVADKCCVSGVMANVPAPPPSGGGAQGGGSGGSGGGGSDGDVPDVPPGGGMPCGGANPNPCPMPKAPPPPGAPQQQADGVTPYGAIGDKYASLGGAGGPLGAPAGGEADAPHGGRCQAFQHGSICWHPQIGEAFGVWGLIHAKWAQLGRASFGYPITDELPTPDGRGRFNHFRGMQYPGRPEASIYWTPQTGAHAIYGAIRDAWAQQGWERGPLGYPTSDEYQDGKYRRSNFERGFIRWAPDTGIEIGR